MEFLRIIHGEKSTDICDYFASTCLSSSENGHVEQKSMSNGLNTNMNNGKEGNTPDDSRNDSSKEEDTKKVHFADDVGKTLSEFRFYDSDEDLVLHNIPFPVDLPTPSIINWTKEFKNPIKNYLTFYNKLNAQSVLLEKLHINDTYCEVSIMVKNLGFEKLVSLHTTYNSWSSTIEIPAFFFLHLSILHRMTSLLAPLPYRMILNVKQLNLPLSLCALIKNIGTTMPAPTIFFERKVTVLQSAPPRRVTVIPLLCVQQKCDTMTTCIQISIFTRTNMTCIHRGIISLTKIDTIKDRCHNS